MREIRCYIQKLEMEVIFSDLQTDIRADQHTLRDLMHGLYLRSTMEDYTATRHRHLANTFGYFRHNSYNPTSLLLKRAANPAIPTV